MPRRLKKSQLAKWLAPSNLIIITNVIKKLPIDIGSVLINTPATMKLFECLSYAATKMAPSTVPSYFFMTRGFYAALLSPIDRNGLY